MQPENSEISTAGTIIYATGAQLLLTVFLCFCLSAAAMAASISFLPAALPAAFIAAFLCTARFFRRRPTAIASAIALVIWTIVSILAINIADPSCDGNFYHQEQVSLLFSGWNPLRNNDIAVSEVWVNHYPVGLEMVGAALMSLTGALQSAKAVIIMMIIAGSALTFGLISDIFPGQPRRRSAIFTLLLISSPVIVTQLLTAYVDGVVTVYIALTTLLCTVLLSDSPRRGLYLLLLAAVLVLAAATKFNALFYEALTGLCFVVGAAIYGRTRQALRIFVFAIAVIIIAMATVLFHPYISNWIQTGHPLYPLMGEGALDIMTDLAPDAIRGHNRFTAFLISFADLNLPLYGQPSGGFSAFFIILLPLSILILAVQWYKNRYFGPLQYIGICLIASTFVFSQSWCARYVPQLWLIVPLAYAASWTLPRPYGASLASIGLLCGATCLCYSAFITWKFSNRRHAVIRVAQSMGTVRVANVLPQTRRIMHEAGVNIIEVPYDSIPPANHEYLATPWFNGIYDISPLVDIPPAQRRTLDSLIQTSPDRRLIRAIRPSDTPDE